MRKTIFEVISSIVYSVIDTFHGNNELSNSAHLNRTVMILYNKLYRMPGFLSISMRILTLVFDWYGFVTTGTRFHKQSPAKRKYQLSLWENSTFATFRDFVRFYQTLSVFIYCSEHYTSESFITPY